MPLRKDGLLLRKLEKSISETITRYDEKGNVRRVRQGKPAKKVVIPGMYKPTKSKEHKALGHKARTCARRERTSLRRRAQGEERKSKYSNEGGCIRQVPLHPPFV